MSVQVLLALVDTEMFKSMSADEIDTATSALRREIESDPELKQRLYQAIEPSVRKYAAAHQMESAVE